VSGFSAAWLALREPADHRSRNRGLLAALASAFAERHEIRVVDLGCGTGSNLCACAPHLPPRQHWRLVDHNPVLLAEARLRLSAWATPCTSAGDDLRLTSGNRTISVSFVCTDLTAGLNAALGVQPDLATGAALFDLASAEWIQHFADAVVRRGAAAYVALTYNGAMRWAPPHRADAAIANAFHAHMRRDKGFGPSAGPQASDALVEILTTSGYAVQAAESSWQLGSADAPLVHALAKGIADAVGQTGRVDAREIAAWLQARLTSALCTIGHTDVLALPTRCPSRARVAR
jgi:hypothetical protein